MSNNSRFSSENEPNERTQAESSSASEAGEPTSNKPTENPKVKINENFLKVRGEKYIKLTRPSNANDQSFDVYNDPKDQEPSGFVSVDDLRARIEPWLGALLQAEHLSLLVGSGLSEAIRGEATRQEDVAKESVQQSADDAERDVDESLQASGNQNHDENDDKKNENGNGMGDAVSNTSLASKINPKIEESAKAGGRGDRPNLEDYFRVANELLRGLEILDEKGYAQELKAEIEQKIRKFTDNILVIENQIATADEEKRKEAFQKLTRFLVPFASRSGVRERLNLFTTNYDRVLEAGADVAGLRLVDRFVGALSPIFRSSRLDVDMHYNPPGIRGEPRYLEGVVRYAKLHGSIDWISANDEIRRIGLPFGATSVEPYLQAPGLNADASKIMIYPNAAKDRETAEYPYVELFRDFAAAICRPNSVLVTYGYSFGDEHINRVIRDMLTIPSTHLLAIAYDDNSGRIMKAFEDWGRQNQISLMIGPDLADLDKLVDNFLPRPAIDEKLICMTDNLRRRYGESRQSGNKEGDQ